MLITPTIKLTMHAVISEKVFMLTLLSFTWAIAKIIEPKIAGILNKNEKVVISFLSQPHIKPVAIVLPLRLMPGKHAIP